MIKPVPILARSRQEQSIRDSSRELRKHTYIGRCLDTGQSGAVAICEPGVRFHSDRTCRA
jgi:hypothetical protein